MNDSFSIVVTLTFIVITLITFISLSKHYKVYQFLKGLEKELSGDPNYSVFMQKLKNHYDTLTENGTKPVEKEAFIEAFMSEYKLDNGKSLIKPLKWNQSAGNIVILIGVLGTFIGLVLALSEINYNEMNQSVLQLLNGIHTAFYTSIFGIFASIIIHFFTKGFHAEQLLMQVMFKIENYLHAESEADKDQQVVSILQDVRESMFEMKNSLSGLGEFSKQFEVASDHLNHFNDQFGQNADKMIDHFTDVKQLGDVLNENVNKLDGHFTKMSDAFTLQEQLVSGLKTNLDSYGKEIREFSANQATFQKQQLDAIGQFLGTTKEQKNQLQTFLSSFKAEIEQVFQHTTNFYENVLASQKQLASFQERLESKNGELIKNVERATIGMKEIVDQGAFQQIGDIAASFSSGIQKLDNRFAQFSQFLQKVDQKETDFIQLLSEHTTAFDRLKTQMKDEQRSLTSALQQFVGQNEMVDVSMKESVQILKTFDRNSMLMVDQMKQMNDEMSKRFMDNDRSFQKTTSDLRQLLEEFTEQTMLNLERVIRQSNDAVDLNSGNMVRQLERQVDLLMNLLDKKFDSLLQQMDQTSTTTNRNFESMVRELESTNRRREQAGM